MIINNNNNNNRNKTIKFQELEDDTIYKVKEFSDPIIGKYGTSYVMKVKNITSGDIFEVWSNKFLATYIKETNPERSFKFTVKINDKGIKIPVIDGYDNGKFTILYDSDSDDE